MNLAETISARISAAADFVWGPFLLIPLLLLTGFFLTIRLRGLQFTQLGPALYQALIVRKEAEGLASTLLQPYSQHNATRCKVLQHPYGIQARRTSRGAAKGALKLVR